MFDLFGLNLGKKVLDKITGKDNFDTMLSGIPFVGEGFAAEDNREFQAAQTAQQMHFQERMSNTAHQRQVKDMRAAGLNPLLSAGAGASAPMGASASGSMGSGAGSSAQMLKSVFNLERQRAKADIAKTEADTAVANIAKDVQAEQKKVLQHTAKSVAQDIDLKEYSKAGAKVRADFENQYGAEKLKADALLDTIQKGAASAGSFMNLIPRRGPKIPKGSLPKKRSRRKEYYDSQGEHTGSVFESY